MPFTLGQLVELVGGELSGPELSGPELSGPELSGPELSGPELSGQQGSIEILGVAPLQDAISGDISLADHAKHFSKVMQSQASAFIVPLDFPQIDKPFIRSSDPHEAFIRVHQLFRPQRQVHAGGIHPQACVEASAIVGAGCYIGPGASVGADVVIGERCRIHAGVHIQAGSRVGDDCELYPGVVLYANTILEQRVLIHAGSVLGAFGFGYKTRGNQHHRTAQLGWVHIESDVEIGAGVTIDRGTYGATRIGAGTKIDNQVQIAHNCRIGRHNLICAQVGIAGSCTTGNYVVLGGQVGMKDHIHLSDGVMVGAQAGLMSDAAPGEILLGSPAIKQKEQMQIFALQMRLPEMRKQLKQLQAIVESLRGDKDAMQSGDAA